MHATITAHLATPVVGEVGMLDGPVAWAAAQLAMQAGVELPPITDERIHDFDLPFHRWEEDGMWGWCVSAPIATPAHHGAMEFRRKPAAQAMALYTAAKEHHSGLGPTKARNVTTAITHHEKIAWHARVADPDLLTESLDIITHLGARHRNGMGRVRTWTITDGPVDGWKNRPLPSPTGRLMRVRAPYWHPTERTPCD